MECFDVFQNSSFSPPAARSPRGFSLVLTVGTRSNSWRLISWCFTMWLGPPKVFNPQICPRWESGNLSIAVQLSLSVSQFLLLRLCCCKLTLPASLSNLGKSGLLWVLTTLIDLINVDFSVFEVFLLLKWSGGFKFLAHRTGN